MLDQLIRRGDHHDACGSGCVSPQEGRPVLGPITIMNQPFEPFIAEALEAVETERLPDFSIVGPVGTFKGRLASELSRCGFGPGWLADWLAENICFQTRLFAELTDARTLTLRLEPVVDDGCTRFHLDNVRYRLLCTYRGPGTEWLDPKAMMTGSAGESLQLTAMRQLQQGQIAVVRGSRDATPDRPGLFHRSPHIEGTGIVRLLLVIDEVDN